MTKPCGLTLVEVLVALAVGSVLVGLTVAMFGSARGLAAVVEARATAGTRATAVPVLVGEVLAQAGRGVDGCGLHVANAGRLARVRGIAAGDSAATTIEVFPGVDGGGRPALYHRRLPHARQPWLEDVTGFEVVAARDGDGSWRPVAHDGITRWSGVRLQLTWFDGETRSFAVELPHMPCAEDMP